MKRVAVTRAAPENMSTAARLRGLGAEPILAPLIQIIPCGYDTNVADAQALIFTSTNGVRAFPAIRDAQHCVVLTVGDATAEAARDAGLRNVRSADGDVRALAELARATLDPARGKLVHIAGDHVAGDLAGELRAAGFTVERRLAYAARPVAALPAAFAAGLDIVLFHSPRAASIFIDLGAPNATHLTAACFSPNVAEAARKTAWKQVIVSPAPREDAFLTAALSG